MIFPLGVLRYVLCVFLSLNVFFCYAQQVLPAQKDYVKHHTAPPKLNLNQAVFHCVYWEEPAAPDEASARWYRAATTLHSRHFSDEEYRKMLILYEAAARRGHYQAIRNLVAVYGKDRESRPYKRLLEPEKARYWINYGLNQGWPTAFDWLATAYFMGNALYPRDDQLSQAYLQKAAYLGVPSAQYFLSRIYREGGPNQMQEDLFACAAKNDTLAMDLAAISSEVSDEKNQALTLYQRSLMGGGFSHGALVLSGAFVMGSPYQRNLETPIDPERAKAYQELLFFLRSLDGFSNRGNRFIKFSRLDEVLPLPPAVMPPWQGIYSAMSPDDAEYYQNMPSVDVYIQEIKDAGLLVGDDYLSPSSPMPVDEPLENYY